MHNFFRINAKVSGRNLCSLANDCLVNLSDLSEMLVKKQMKYIGPCMESLGFTRTIKYNNK